MITTQNISSMMTWSCWKSTSYNKYQTQSILHVKSNSKFDDLIWYSNRRSNDEWWWKECWKQ
jgi:hypothetical protein